MCIIVVKHEGSILAKETLETCFHNNNDGAGFMWLDEDKQAVVGDKGYMSFKDLWRGLERKGWINSEGDVHAERGIVLHFRLGTHGTTTAPLTHPFPISAEENDLRLLNWESDWGMVHNGVISGMIDYNNKKNISDTMIFVRDYLADEKVLSVLDHGPCVRLMFMGMRASNRFVFLNSKGELILVGNFVRGQDGNIYSNSSFQQKVQRYNTYRMNGSRINPAAYGTKLYPSDGKLVASCPKPGPCSDCQQYTFYPQGTVASSKHWCDHFRGYLYTLSLRR